MNDHENENRNGTILANNRNTVKEKSKKERSLSKRII